MALQFLGVLVLLAAVAPPTSTVYDSPQGEFAFTVPAGWETKVEREEKFPTVAGPKDDPNAPYVVIKEVRGSKDLIELANATVREMLKDQIYQIAARDAFQTADKKDGYKYVFSTLTEPHYRQAMYFVEGGAGRIFVIVATVPEAGWKKYEPLLGVMAASFRLRPSETQKNSAAPPVPSPPTSPAKPVLRGGGR